MSGGTRIHELIPHQGAMCLLDEIATWDRDRIICRARTHLSPDNPLRVEGRLGALCGVEYGLQAAALHGALAAGGEQQKPGFLASLRDVVLAVERLDDPEFGALEVEASCELSDRSGLVYSFVLRASSGCVLISGRAAISLQSSASWQAHGSGQRPARGQAKPGH
ncbi:MAG: hypothetical protein JO303_04190 [Caulobacteraceae bacterium]|nr:hypothetical protein [Caulobacteraceae bacterium]